MSADKKFALKVALGCWLGFGFFIGAMNTSMERETKSGTGCVYKSVASFISPGYIIGCELFRKRWEIGN